MQRFGEPFAQPLEGELAVARLAARVLSHGGHARSDERGLDTHADAHIAVTTGGG